jgi:hypothetical protein
MKQTLVRYKTKPDAVEENKRLIQKVFEELRATSPAGFRYLALKLEDGSFVHLKIDTQEDADPITAVQAFQSFQQNIKDRCSEPAQASEVTIIGNYRMFEA